MRLVICEKPSVGMSIAAVLGLKSRHDGYIEGGGYIVSWCFGHLAGLANAEVYDERFSKWRYDDLPILPGKWEYVVGKEKMKQFDTLFPYTTLFRLSEERRVGKECSIIILRYQLYKPHT